ncbi:putative nuclease HARBI1 [Tanacetum coccineum]
MQESFNRSHSSLRSAIERSFGILKKRWKILRKMPKYSVENQLDIITAAFSFHNYIRNNDKEDTVFTTFEQHPDYMGGDELHDVRGLGANHEDISSGTSNEMKQIRNDIATSIWNARRRQTRKEGSIKMLSRILLASKPSSSKSLIKTLLFSSSQSQNQVSRIIKGHYRCFSSENNDNNNNKSSWNISSSLGGGGGEESIESLFSFNAIQEEQVSKNPNDGNNNDNDGVFALSGQEDIEKKQQQQEEENRLLDEEAKSLSDVLNESLAADLPC